MYFVLLTDGGPCLVYTKYEEIRLVLFGGKGSGKSATGNSILGSNAFKSMLSGRSRVCSLKTSVRFDKKVVIVDTPGIFDTTETSEITQQEIYKCIGMSYPGPHAFLFVINIAMRFTQETERSFDFFVRQFGKNILRYVFVLFTRKDELDRHNIDLNDHLNNFSPQALRSLIKKCGDRVIAFDNNREGVESDTQVQDLLKKIQTNLERNGGECYTNEMYKETERKIQKIEREKKKEKDEERKREFEDIDKKLEEKYKQTLEEERNTLTHLQAELESLHKTHEQKSHDMANLMKTVALFEKQLKESKGKEKVDLQQTTKVLRKELVEILENTIKIEKMIENIQKVEHHSKERVDNLLKKRTKEMERACKKYEEKEDERIREEVRKEIEEAPYGRGILHIFTGFVSSVFSFS